MELSWEKKNCKKVLRAGNDNGGNEEVRLDSFVPHGEDCRDIAQIFFFFENWRIDIQ